MWQLEQLVEQLAAQLAQLWARQSVLLAQQLGLLPLLRLSAQVRLGMAHQWAPASPLLKASQVVPLLHGLGQRVLEVPGWEALQSSPPPEALLAQVAVLWAAQRLHELERQSAHLWSAVLVVLQSVLPHHGVLWLASLRHPKTAVRWRWALA